MNENNFDATTLRNYPLVYRWSNETTIDQITLCTIYLLEELRIIYLLEKSRTIELLEELRTIYIEELRTIYVNIYSVCVLYLEQWFLSFLKTGNTFDYKKNLRNSKIDDPKNKQIHAA